MKKTVRNLFAAFAAAALIGSLASCAASDEENPFVAASTNGSESGKSSGGNSGAGAGDVLSSYKTQEITFNVTENSTSAEDTVLLIKYDRSKPGADELITVIEADLTVKKNGEVIETFEKIEFALDEYGSAFSSDSPSYPIGDKNDIKEYKAKLSIGKTVASGDTIVVSLTKCKIDGTGIESFDPTKIVIALIDKSATVNYYKELCSEEYQPIFVSKTPSSLPSADDSNSSLVEDNTEGGNESVVELFSGSQKIDWGENGLVIDHEKFTGDFNALRITYNASAGALKLAVCDPWTDVIATGISSGSIGEDGALNLPVGDAQTVTVNLNDSSVAGIKGSGIDGAWGGLKLYGAETITITKVEAIKAE